MTLYWGVEARRQFSRGEFYETVLVKNQESILGSRSLLIDALVHGAIDNQFEK